MSFKKYSCMLFSAVPDHKPSLKVLNVYHCSERGTRIIRDNLKRSFQWKLSIIYILYDGKYIYIHVYIYYFMSVQFPTDVIKNGI